MNKLKQFSLIMPNLFELYIATGLLWKQDTDTQDILNAI